MPIIELESLKWLIIHALYKSVPSLCTLYNSGENRHMASNACACAVLRNALPRPVHSNFYHHSTPQSVVLCLASPYPPCSLKFGRVALQEKANDQTEKTKNGAENLND